MPRFTVPPYLLRTRLRFSVCALPSAAAGRRRALAHRVGNNPLPFMACSKNGCTAVTESDSPPPPPPKGGQRPAVPPRVAPAPQANGSKVPPAAPQAGKQPSPASTPIPQAKAPQTPSAQPSTTAVQANRSTGTEAASGRRGCREDRLECAQATAGQRRPPRHRLFRHQCRVLRPLLRLFGPRAPTAKLRAAPRRLRRQPQRLRKARANRIRLFPNGR